MIQAFNTEAEWLAARVGNISSTESPALFGLSPYATPFELFHRKAGNYTAEFVENERSTWGRRLQDAIAVGCAEDEGLELIPEPYRYTYAKHPTVTRMGTSYDRLVICKERGPGLLEIKNVDSLVYKNTWVDDGEDSAAPPHIELQTQHQLETLGLAWGGIRALVGGNRIVRLDREANAQVGAAIRQRVDDFWADVAANEPPPPDFNADAATIAQLYGYAEPGKVLTGADVPARLADLSASHKVYSAAAKSAKDGLEAVVAEVKTIMGDHESAFAAGFKILATVTAESVVPGYTRKAYRAVRIYHTKEK